MEAGEGKNALGPYLRGELAKAGMSLRELARECGLDPSTVSRLLTGKLRPRPEHLASIARVLRLDALQLWRTAGYMSDAPGVPTAAGGSAPQRWGEDPGACPLPMLEGLDVQRIQAELDKYQLYAQTEEGREIILREFEKKVAQVNAVGPFINKLKALHRLYLSDRIDPAQKSIVGGVLLYFILPTDVIPDYLFPIGYLDDALAIDVVWQKVRSFVAEGELSV